MERMARMARMARMPRMARMARMARKTKMFLDYNKDEGSDDGMNDEELHTRLIVMMMTMLMRKMTISVEMRKMTTLV